MQFSSSNVIVSALGLSCVNVFLVNVTFTQRHTIAGFAMTHSITGASTASVTAVNVLSTPDLYCPQLHELVTSGGTLSNGLLTTAGTSLSTLDNPNGQPGAFAVAYNTEVSMPHSVYIILDQEPASFSVSGIQVTRGVNGDLVNYGRCAERLECPQGCEETVGTTDSCQLSSEYSSGTSDAATCSASVPECPHSIADPGVVYTGYSLYVPSPHSPPAAPPPYDPCGTCQDQCRVVDGVCKKGDPPSETCTTPEKCRDGCQLMSQLCWGPATATEDACMGNAPSRHPCTHFLSPPPSPPHTESPHPPQPPPPAPPSTPPTPPPPSLPPPSPPPHLFMYLEDELLDPYLNVGGYDPSAYYANMSIWSGFDYIVTFVGNFPLLENNTARWVPEGSECDADDLPYSETHSYTSTIEPADPAMRVNLPSGPYKFCLRQDWEATNVRRALILKDHNITIVPSNPRDERRLNENHDYHSNFGLTLSSVIAPPPPSPPPPQPPSPSLPPPSPPPPSPSPDPPLPSPPTPLSPSPTPTSPPPTSSPPPTGGTLLMSPPPPAGGTLLKSPPPPPPAGGTLLKSPPPPPSTIRTCQDAAQSLEVNLCCRKPPRQTEQNRFTECQIANGIFKSECSQCQAE